MVRTSGRARERVWRERGKGEGGRGGNIRTLVEGVK